MEIHRPERVSLWAAAALTSGWPLLRLRSSSEATLMGLLELVQHQIGSLPQCVIDVPWDNGDPWLASAELPNLSPKAWLALAMAVPQVWLVPGDRPGQVAAIEQGRASWELIACGDVLARQWLAQGTPDLVKLDSTDEQLAALEREIISALRLAGTALQASSARGQDTVQPVRGARGRLGVQISLETVAFTDLDGQKTADLRREVVAQLARVVIARAEHPKLRLAPDLEWWEPLGAMDVVIWLVIQPVAVRHQPIRASFAPQPGIPRAEVQLVPAEASSHQALMLAALPIAERHQLIGGPPRWVHTGREWVFAGSWVADTGVDLVELATDLAELPGAHAVRVLPGQPAGMNEIWPAADPEWSTHMGGVSMTVRHAISRRQRLPQVDEREIAAADLAVLAVVMTALLAAQVQPSQPPAPVLWGSAPALLWRFVGLSADDHERALTVLTSTPIPQQSAVCALVGRTLSILLAVPGPSGLG